MIVRSKSPSSGVRPDIVADFAARTFQRQPPRIAILGRYLRHAPTSRVRDTGRFDSGLL
jgi:hypothetical protein